MKYIWLTLLFFSCAVTEQKDFGQVARAFVAQYGALFPDESPLSAENNLLTSLHIPTAAVMDSVKLFHQTFSKALSAYDERKLPPSVKSDYNKVKNILTSVGNYLKNHNSQPTYFNIRYGFERILAKPYASDEHRLQTIFQKLEHVPLFYEHAKARLKGASIPSTQAVVTEHLKTYQFFSETLPHFIKVRKMMTPQFAARLNAATLAIKDYVAYVESFKLQ